MVRLRTLTVMVVVAVAIGTSCSGGGSETSQSSPSTSSPATTVPATSTQPPTTTAAPTTTVDPIALAGEKYIEFVKPSNCMIGLIQILEADIIGDDGFYEREWPKVLEQIVPAYKTLADDTVTFVEKLVSYDWPDEVQSDVDALVTELVQWAGWYAGLGAATSFDSWNAAIEAQIPAETGAATIVRAKLGLPSNINNDENFCEGIL